MHVDVGYPHPCNFAQPTTGEKHRKDEAAIWPVVRKLAHEPPNFLRAQGPRRGIGRLLARQLEPLARVNVDQATLDSDFADVRECSDRVDSG